MPLLIFFFFNDTATTEIYTLSLHDALPIFPEHPDPAVAAAAHHPVDRDCAGRAHRYLLRSEEHTSELQSRPHLVCRLLLAKKKNPANKGAPQVRFQARLTPRTGSSSSPTSP